MEYINYMEPSYDCHEIEAVTTYMNSGAWLTEFKQTRNFEQSIADYVRAPFCSVMSNGTVTLIAALMAMGIKPGDEVIVPDFTMSATSHAVALLGATPIFVDVEPETLCMDYGRMKKAVTKNTKAVICVDLNGRYPKQFDEIIEFCKQNELWMLEDAAQALGSNYKGIPLGTFGDVGSFSFSMPKIITTGQGGAIVTSSQELYEKVLKIRDFGREEAGSDHYMTIGANFKFTDIQAVIGIEQIKKMPIRVLQKKEICKAYDARLHGMREIKIFKHNYEETVPCFYEILCERRGELMEYLKQNNIGSRRFYPALHAEPAYYAKADCPVTEEISAKGLWLPSSVRLDEEKINYICDIIERFYS